jgi:hypothetical protein
MTRLAFLAALFAGTVGQAADLSKLDRRIGKEPAYKTKSPRYALLVLGPEAKDRVWLVKDGDTLYVDRNGNGDLTEPGEKITAKKSGSADDGYDYEIDELTLGGTKHFNLRVGVSPLRRWMYNENARRDDLQAALKNDPQAEALSLILDATMPHLKPKGQVFFVAGPTDLNGPLCLAAKPADAPVIHLGGPLQVTFSERRPTLRLNRTSELVFAVGTPGLGAGTFARVGFDETIPKAVHPVGEMTFPPAKPGGEPVKKRFEFKERC